MALCYSSLASTVRPILPLNRARKKSHIAEHQSRSELQLSAWPENNTHYHLASESQSYGRQRILRVVVNIRIHQCRFHQTHFQGHENQLIQSPSVSAIC